MVKVTLLNGKMKWSSPGMWFSLLIRAANMIRQPAEVCKVARSHSGGGGGMAIEDCSNGVKFIPFPLLQM